LLGLDEWSGERAAWHAHDQVVAEPEDDVVEAFVDDAQWLVRQVGVLLLEQASHEVDVDRDLGRRLGPRSRRARSSSGKTHVMAIRDTLRANAAKHLQAGETIQAVFPAQTVSQYFALLSYWIIFFQNALRVVVVTDRRILICKSGRLRMSPVNDVVGEVPRNTRIGPATGLWYKTEALGQKLYINRRFFKDVEAADAVLTS
jgi:hypothetical protein